MQKQHISSTLKILHYTDPHLCEKNPPTRLGNYREDIIDKIKQIMIIGQERSVDITTCGGDLFGPKTPGSTKHSMIYELSSIYNSFPITHLANPGNHDLTDDNMDSLSSQPLGVLFASKVLKQMTNSLPVFEKGDLKVRFYAFPFTETPDMDDIKCERDPGIDVNILGIHVYASPAGGSLWGKTKVYSYDEISKSNYDVYLMGHYHADNGVVCEDLGLGFNQTFVNIGSLSRGDHGDNNIDRKPKVCLITITKDESGNVSINTEQIYLKVKSKEEVFDLVKKEKIEEQKKSTEVFTAKLLESSKKTDTDVVIKDQLESYNLEKVIFDTTMEYINKAHNLISNGTVEE